MKPAIYHLPIHAFGRYRAAHIRAKRVAQALRRQSRNG